MANFTRTWNPPLAFNGIVSETALNDLDIKSTKTINAAEGSVHAPTSPIIIGGTGLTMTGPFTAAAVNLTDGLIVVAAASSGHIGVQGAGDGSGAGAAFQGGSTGTGVIALGGGGNAPGVDASGAGTGPAVQCSAGGVRFSGTQPAKNADPGINMAHATNQAKAWAHITTDGAGNATIDDGYNVTTAAPAVSNALDVTYARSMSSATYAVLVTMMKASPVFVCVDDNITDATKVRLALYDSAGSPLSWATTATKVAIAVFARQ